MSTAPTIEHPSIPARRIRTRRIEFQYAEGQLPRHFANGDPVMSHVVAVLSSLFPEGEDFFVRSVRNFRDRITDPELKRQVGGFIGQEAIHGREHRTFNRRLQSMGYPTWLIDRLTKWGLAFGAKTLPKSHQLAITAALEHYTATLAELLLSTPEARDLIDDPEVKSLFLWHALEESEHKSVAFDVFESVSGNTGVRRRIMKATTVGFLLAVAAGTSFSMLIDGSTYRHPVRTARSVRALRHSPWLSKQLRARIRDYNRTGFHPDDHDSRELLAEWREILFGDTGSLAPRVKGGEAALAAAM